jgi:hypothetical protein
MELSSVARGGSLEKRPNKALLPRCLISALRRGNIDKN